MAREHEDPGTTIRDVPAWSIDRFCAERNIAPTVIKIDVEGAELAALRGARATIASAGPRLQLFVEMHPQLWPSFGITAEDIRRECDTQGLDVGQQESLDGIELFDLKRSYRFEQGFTLELYTSKDSQEARDAFVEKRDASFETSKK